MTATAPVVTTTPARLTLTHTETGDTIEFDSVRGLVGHFAEPTVWPEEYQFTAVEPASRTVALECLTEESARELTSEPWGSTQVVADGRTVHITWQGKDSRAPWEVAEYARYRKLAAPIFCNRIMIAFAG